MIESIQMSRIYGLKLLELYGGTNYNCVIIGTTNIDNVSNNLDEYNIYDTFFKPLGLGLTSYTTSIHSNTVIYICKVVDSLEPLTISDEKIFIPSSLIDMDHSIEYKECSNFNFNIYPVIRRFTGQSEREQYINDIKDKMKVLLKRLIDFSILENNIDVSYSSIYLPEEDINAIENKRLNEFNDYNKRLYDKDSASREKELQYNKAITDAAIEKSKYAQLNEELTTKLEALNAEINYYKSLNAALEQQVGT